MSKINYQNLPNTTTPLIASNLNLMQEISEAGSNANGNYIKYEDGILIQWNDMEVDDQAIDNPYGSLYQGTRIITLPVDFKDNHYSAVCTQFLWGTSASWGSVVQRNNKSSFSIRGFDLFSRPSGTRTNISWFAIGKWK